MAAEQLEHRPEHAVPAPVAEPGIIDQRHDRPIVLRHAHSWPPPSLLQCKKRATHSRDARLRQQAVPSREPGLTPKEVSELRTNPGPLHERRVWRKPQDSRSSRLDLVGMRESRRLTCGDCLRLASTAKPLIGLRWHENCILPRGGEGGTCRTLAFW